MVVRQKRLIRSTYFVVAALLSSAPIFADTGFLDRSVTLKGVTHRYQVFVPSGYTPTREWPIVVDLHGGGAQGSDGIRQTAHFLADQIRLRRGRFPLIAVFPQAATGTDWLEPEMQDLVLAEIDSSLAEFHSDPKRVYLTGFSMGAGGVYRLAARFPERFAALVAIAGQVEVDTLWGPEKTAIDRRTNVYVNASDPFAALADRIRGTPTRIFHGETDDVISVTQSRRLFAALKNIDAKVQYTEYPDTHHGPAAEKTYADESLVTWLLSQRRTAPSAELRERNSAHKP
jgi:predicted peptidase